MKIVLIRHEKVDMKWEKRYDSRSFDKACRSYDEAPVFAGKCERMYTNRADIYVSSLSRTKETAEKLFGEKKIIATKLLDEVPMTSFTDTKREYPAGLWSFMARIQWYFQKKRQPEIRRDTIRRSKELIAYLEEKHRDCYCVTHGFFMITLIKEMKKQGYRAEKSKGFGFSNLEQIVMTK